MAAKKEYTYFYNTFHPALQQEIREWLEMFLNKISKPIKSDEQAEGHAWKLDEQLWQANWPTPRKTDKFTYEFCHELLKYLPQLKGAAHKLYDRAKNEGIKEGKRALVMLNRGEMSLSDFEKFGEDEDDS